MPKVFTTGLEVRIGTYGLATKDAPAIVPDEVADEYDGRDGYVVERDAKPAPLTRVRPATLPASVLKDAQKDKED